MSRTPLGLLLLIVVMVLLSRAMAATAARMPRKVLALIVYNYFIIKHFGIGVRVILMIVFVACYHCTVII